MYDAFISYRRGDPDRGIGVRLDGLLREVGFDIALDERDFSPQETFLDEMARCVKKSRFTIALLSNRYLESFNAHEEAVMQKCLDNRQRIRRLVPVYIEPCSPPLWMESLVGIRLYEKESEPGPLQKIVDILAAENEKIEMEKDKLLDMIGRRWPEMLDVAASGIIIGTTGLSLAEKLIRKKKSIGDSDSLDSRSEALQSSSGADSDAGADAFSYLKDIFSDIF